MEDKSQPLIIETSGPMEAELIQGSVVVGDPYPAPPPYLQPNPYQPQQQYYQPNNQIPRQYQGVQPGQGYYYQQMPPPPPLVAEAMPIEIINHPQIVMIQEQLMLVCPSCGFLGSYARQSAGCAVFSWCVCLFICTGIFCFWVPFCIDSCYDVEVVCSRCGFVKSRIEAGCP